MIYAVKGCTGSYEDYQDWIVGYRETKEEADAWAAALKAGEQQIMRDWLAYAKHAAETKRDKYPWNAWHRDRGDTLIAEMKKHDPQFWWDLGTDYEVVEIAELPAEVPEIVIVEEQS